VVVVSRTGAVLTMLSSVVVVVLTEGCLSSVLQAGSASKARAAKQDRVMIFIGLWMVNVRVPSWWLWWFSFPQPLEEPEQAPPEELPGPICGR